MTANVWVDSTHNRMRFYLQADNPGIHMFTISYVDFNEHKDYSSYPGGQCLVNSFDKTANLTQEMLNFHDPTKSEYLGLKTLPYVEEGE